MAQITDEERAAFLEFLRPATISFRCASYRLTDRRKARRLARKSGHRFRIVNSRPRKYIIDEFIRTIPFNFRIKEPIEPPA
jgi:hypothetical protein